MTKREVLKMYSDYKSPYAWLAFDPAFALEQRFAQGEVDAVSVADQGVRAKKRVFGIQGQVLLHGCPKDRERARRQEDHPRSSQGLRHGPCPDWRIVRREVRENRRVQ